jgi:hypothetical protein
MLSDQQNVIESRTSTMQKSSERLHKIVASNNLSQNNDKIFSDIK